MEFTLKQNLSSYSLDFVMEVSHPAPHDAAKPCLLPRKTFKHSAAIKQLPVSEKKLSLSQQHQDQIGSESSTQNQRQKEVDEICHVLLRAPEERDALDIDTLYDWVLKNGSTNKIFHGAQEIICKTICREMTLLKLPAQGVVCYQGDYGDTFYIILTGSVSLFINAKPKPKYSSDDEFDYRLASLYEDEGTTKLDQYGTFIKHITDGGTFGELAVMDPTARRSCTVTCDEPTSFICLKRGAYQRLIRMTNSSHLDFTQIEFLETMFFFEGWRHNELNRLLNRLRQVHFPANSYLARLGTEPQGVFFIYAGLVQETVPTIQFLSHNGNVQRCAELKSNVLNQTMQDLGEKRHASKLRQLAELELTLYQDHDICAEYPIMFNQPFCSTNLLAVTDVKALVMDRETWKEFFFMHARDYIRETFSKFRKLAGAREIWRKTRINLALANPGLILTISTKAMMLDGKCLCGWCGNADHTTGDACCPGLSASKKKQEDRQKKVNAKRNKKSLGVPAKTSISMTCSILPVDLSSGEPNVTTSADSTHTECKPGASYATLALKPTPSNLSASQSLRNSNISTNQVERPQTDPAKSSKQVEERILVKRPTEICAPNTLKNIATQRKLAISDHLKFHKISDCLYEYEISPEKREEQNLPAIKVEDVRKGTFTEVIADQYRHEMMRKVKHMSCMEQYIGARAEVLELLTTPHEVDDHMRHRLPRKPKIPKPRRPTVNPKTRQPRPDRFNRKINRMLRKIWRKEHPLPVVEESLRDSDHLQAIFA